MTLLQCGTRRASCKVPPAPRVRPTLRFQARRGTGLLEREMTSSPLISFASGSRTRLIPWTTRWRHPWLCMGASLRASAAKVFTALPTTPELRLSPPLPVTSALCGQCLGDHRQSFVVLFLAYSPPMALCASSLNGWTQSTLGLALDSAGHQHRGADLVTRNVSCLL